jgi:hypothetical protein
MDLIRAERHHGGGGSTFEGRIQNQALEPAAQQVYEAQGRPGLPPSDLRKSPTTGLGLQVSSSCDMAMTSFWQMDPPDEVQ